jgi:predicted nucleic acid-binding protein
MNYLRYLLDTSVYSQPIKEISIPMVLQRWGQLPYENVATSSICEAEVLKGLEWRGSRQLWTKYEMILQGKCVVIPFDQPCAVQFAKISAQLRKKGHTRDNMDLLIAATARAHGLIVATLNAKHFAGIEGVAVEDWSR